MRIGIPRILTTDNGGEFKNELDSELANHLGIKRILTTPYHPQVGFCFGIASVFHILIFVCII